MDDGVGDGVGCFCLDPRTSFRLCEKRSDEAISFFKRQTATILCQTDFHATLRCLMAKDLAVTDKRKEKDSSQKRLRLTGKKPGSTPEPGLHQSLSS